MPDAQALRRAAVVAELASGATLLATSLKYDIAQATCSKWFRDSGLTRQPVPRSKLAPEKRRRIERMLRDGRTLEEVRRQSGASKASILKVRAELEQQRGNANV